MKRVVQAILCAFVLVFSIFMRAEAAPYAAVVIDARDGKVLFSRNANQPLHPASLTKMMTLYIAFAEVEAGRISLNDNVNISKNAASAPPSKIGLKAGSSMKLNYLLRAAAIKSANDAATAIGEHISGSEGNFAQYMTQTARALGMKNSNFKNAHGLTQSGHQSTAMDMAILGRRLVYDFPQYYNLFAREYAQTPLGNFRNSNIRFLRDYPGADGIKTGYTRAAGYNLVASAQRGNERIIVSMFGGTNSYQRNQQVGALMDLGFREAPSSKRLANLPKIRLQGSTKQVVAAAAPATQQPSQASTAQAAPQPSQSSAKISRPTARPVQLVLLTEPAISSENVSMQIAKAENNSADLIARPAPRNAAQPSTSNLEPSYSTIGDFSVQFSANENREGAEQDLIDASVENYQNLSLASNQVVAFSFNGKKMYRARFSGISKEAAYSTCSKYHSNNQECYIIAPDIGG